MRHTNMTFSIPEDLKAVLYSTVGRTNISRFISNAVRKSLEEEALQKEKNLDLAYEAANQDEDRLKTILEWNALDTENDIFDKNENWEWLKTNAKTKKRTNKANNV